MMACRRKIILAILLAAGILAGIGICLFHRDKVNHDLGCSISPGYYYRGKGTPAEFITSQLGYNNDIVKALNLLIPERLDRGDYLPEGSSKKGAREIVRKFREEADRGFAWKTPRMKMRIPRSSSWERTALLHGEVPLDTVAKPQGRTLWKLRYNEQFLYAKAEVVDDDLRLDHIRPYNADSVELFVKYDPNLFGYWEMVASPGVSPFSSRHSFSPVMGLRVTQQNVFPVGSVIKARKTEKGYEAEFRLPFSALARLDGALPRSGAVLELMFVRTDLGHSGYRKTAPVPLLYDGHNIFGYIQAELE